ncbi:arylesterase [Sphingobium sufflavum]|uniref:arylesterase n=1 Tax=Sphingobium sufflavum TaxID=1129547 RepID=UPI001F35F0A7|nr:arylesterase [Sphingobium sufflavum]MCE7795689.1 arylesterase [Sphingobium sufflavum]
MARFRQYGACLALVQLAIACSPSAPEQNGSNRVMATAPISSADTAVPADTKLVLVFGDSLYAGYNLGPSEGLAPVLEQALTAGSLKALVVNGGVSGDTSAAGLARLAFTLDGLPRKPDLVLVGLGGNDMLRGLEPDATRANLAAIITELQKRGLPVMLTGMLASPNMGPDYAGAFNPIYPDLAKKFGVPLYPFFLHGVIDHRELKLPDGIHPNAKGVATIVARLSPMVANKLEK